MPHILVGGSAWTDKEKLQHINILELQAAFFALKVFCKKDKKCTC